ncbi:hypothetical protein ACFLY1_00960 [Patescibacteria group bacterium]
MFFHFNSFIYSLLFLIGLEVIAFSYGLIFYVAFLLFLLSLWGSKKIGGTWIHSIMPTIFTFSSVSFLYLIDPVYSKQVFIILSFIMFYFAMLGAYRLKEYERDQTARGLVIASAAATLFFFYTSFYGIYLNFLIPLWILMLSFLFVTGAVSYQCFRIIRKDNRMISWNYSVLLGMVMAEFAWVMNFWPFGYLTTGVIALIFYYVLWDLAQSYFLDILSKKRVIANVALFSFLVTLVLMSSRWLPVI